MSTYTYGAIKHGSNDVNRILLGRGHTASTVTDGSSTVTGYDIGSDEVWKVYNGGSIICKKDKTFESYWKAHNLVSTNVQASSGTTYMSSEVLSTLNLEDDIKDKDLIIKPVKDLDEHIYSTTNGYVEGLAYHVRPVNKEAFWTPIKEWFANNYVSCGFFYYADVTNFYRAGRFGNSNIYGEVTFNINNSDEDVTGRGGEFNALYYPFRECSGITKLTLHAKDTTKNLAWTSMNSAFCGLSGCTELVYDGTPNIPSDVSDCFTGCKFSTWPRNLMRYDLITTSNYMIDGGSIQVIPLCSLSDDREAACNTLKIKGNQIFRCDWTDIMPCLDASEYTPAHITFGNWTGTNTAAKNVRIKNWNCSYSFDGDKDALGYSTLYSANLPNLDAESIRYLLENLTDLTAYDAELMVNNYLHNFNYGWKYMAVSQEKSKITMSTRTSSYQAASTDTSTGTMKITVSGMQTGDKLTLNDDNTTFATITEDGDYDIEISSRSGWLVWRLQNETDSTITDVVTITNRKPYTAGVAFASSGKLYVPEKWETTYDAVEGNDFDTLVASAVAKGWTVYVGGTEREV